MFGRARVAVLCGLLCLVPSWDSFAAIDCSTGAGGVQKTAADPCVGTPTNVGNNFCTPTGAGQWTCTCASGWVSTGGTTPTCQDFNACTSGSGNAACKTAFAGNTCSDQAAPSSSYTCTCGNAQYEGTGTTSCYVGCTPTNHCRDSGDTAAGCNDTGSGYTCTCDTGFVSNGTSCVSQCPGPPDPCGNGGTCSSTGGGLWSCSCPVGYASSGGARATCVAVVCGDSMVNGPEQCDEGAMNGTTGSCCSASCAFVASSTECLAPTGPCGLGASCTGSSASCPSETFKPATIVCLEASGPCDTGATCAGSSAACPADSFEPSATECASATECKQAASCGGSSDACPAQADVADGTLCSGGNGACTAGVCVQLDMAQAPDMTVVDMTVPAGDDMITPAAADMASAGGNAGCGCIVGGAHVQDEAPFAALCALAILLVFHFRRSSRARACRSTVAVDLRPAR